MSRVSYQRGTQFGSKVAIIINNLANAKEDLNRIKALMDDLTAGGTNLTALESGDGTAYFGVAVGSGANFYNGLVTIKTNLATITDASLADFDQGQP